MGVIRKGGPLFHINSFMTVERNLLPVSDFRIVFGETAELTNLHVYAVSITLPSVSLPDVSTPYRHEPGFVPGNRMAYDPLNIRFMCDENMEIYKDLFNWMRNNTLDHYNSDQLLSVADIRMHILSSHSNMTREIHFMEAFPTSIGSIEFNLQTTEITYASFDATFRYDKFNIEAEPSAC